MVLIQIKQLKCNKLCKNKYFVLNTISLNIKIKNKKLKYSKKYLIYIYIKYY